MAKINVINFDTFSFLELSSHKESHISDIKIHQDKDNNLPFFPTVFKDFHFRMD